MPERSPLAPDRFPDMPEVAGVRLAAAACGIRYKGRSDLMLAVIEPGATVAGVFTRSAMASAPVDWCRAGLKGGKARAVVIDSVVAFKPDRSGETIRPEDKR